MKTITGDLIRLAQDGAFDVIAHGCNCMCAMGAGIVRRIKDAFPAAYKADQDTKKGDRSKLGSCSQAECLISGGTVTVVNAYTQYYWKGDGVLVDYEAARLCMRWLASQHFGKSIGLPKIGAGLAKGNWSRISKIIEEELSGEDVTIVEYLRHA